MAPIEVEQHLHVRRKHRYQQQDQADSRSAACRRQEHTCAADDFDEPTHQNQNPWKRQSGWHSAHVRLWKDKVQDAGAYEKEREQVL